MSTPDTLTIEKLERLRNTGSGNPRFKVTFASGLELVTKKDAAINHAIENSEYQGVPLHVETDNGEIVGLKAA